MTQHETRAETPIRWQIWVISLGDFLRAPSGVVRTFIELAEAQRVAVEVGGIVQMEDGPPLGGFDRALS